MVGQTLSHYKVLEELGRGGMGIVYMAEDTKLDRIVALKVLLSSALASGDDRVRFIEEAKSAAAISHPNIATIYEVNESNGISYIAMEYLEGETLAELIAKGPIPKAAFDSIVPQLVDAISEAHSRGIVHRDIKPANVMILPSGRVKVLDFGLAKRNEGLDLTKEGAAVGTVHYMSPEQIRGEPTSWRTDAWSLGVVMYEMLSGSKPFDGNYEAAVFYSILNEDHEPLTDLDVDVEEEISATLDKLLSKDPGARGQSLSDIVASGQVGVHPGKQSSRNGSRRSGRKFGVTFAMGAVIVLIASATVWVVAGRLDRTPTSDATSRAAIAVLPFENLSDEKSNEHFADGMVDDIITSLQGWGAFPVIARNSTRLYKDQVYDISTVSSALGVRYLLTGSVRSGGDSIRVNAQLIDAETGTHVWVDQFDSPMTNIFSIQDQVTEHIVTAIAPEMVRNEMNRNVIVRPKDLATWELVIKAQALMLEGSFESTVEAKDLLDQALERDPNYALTFARLAEIGHNMSNNHSWVIGNVAAAQALNEALDYARRAVRMNPSLVDARIWYGHLLLHNRMIQEGLVQLREAVKLNSSHAQAHAELSLGLAIDGDLDGALREIETAFRLSPNDPQNERMKTFEALAYLYAAEYPKAVETSRKIINSQPGSGFNVFPYVVEVSALVRQDMLGEARISVAEFESFHGRLVWESIEKGAWSQEQLEQVRRDLRVAGMAE